MNLAAEMAKLPEPPNDSHPPLWAYWRHDLWARAQNDDPRNFMRWPPIYHCMLQDHWPDSIMVELAYLKDEIGGLPFSADTMGEGWPQPSDKDARTKVDKVLSSYRNLIHQTYHILRWQEATGQSIADMERIYEFGGGYGAMALVCNRLGFKGKYYIYDLPEFALLQQWYLEECGVGNVEWVDAAAYGDVDLLIACYSLSETDYAERARILEAWPAKSYLFLYSNVFEDYDNIGYFQTLDYGLNLPRRWAHSHLDHLPPESWYTWGW